MSDQQDQSAQQAAELNFEQAVAQLEQIIEQIERGQVGLEACLTQYERGIALVKRCEAILSKAQQRVAELTRGADGSLRVDDAPAKADESA